MSPPNADGLWAVIGTMVTHAGAAKPKLRHASLRNLYNWDMLNRGSGKHLLRGTGFQDDFPASRVSLDSFGFSKHPWKVQPFWHIGAAEPNGLQIAMKTNGTHCPLLRPS